MATAGYTTMSTTDKTLLDVSVGDPEVLELTFWNVDSTNDILVHVTPVHATGDYMRIPHTPTNAATVPISIRAPSVMITKVVAHSSAGTPILSWSVTER